MGLPTEACQMVNGLTRKQKAVCAESPALIPVILQVLHRILSALELKLLCCLHLYSFCKNLLNLDPDDKLIIP